MTRSRYIAAASATLLAFCIRSWNLVSLKTSPFFGALTGDSARYDQWAQELASGNWLGTEVFYQAPLYPYWLGLTYASLGRDLLSIQILQAAVGSVSCGLLALSAARYFQSSWTGFIAGLLLALYAPIVFHDALLQKSVLDVFFLCLLLFFLSANLDRPRVFVSALSGAALALMILTRENAAVLGVAIVAWILIRGHHPLRTRLGHIAAFGLAVALVLSPVALRNLWVGGEFHLTSTQFGHNLYLGNNPDANGTYQPLLWGRGDSEWVDARTLAGRDLGRDLDPSEVSDYWTEKVKAYVRAQPLDWLALLTQKFLLLWNATEIVDTEDQYTHARFSPVLAMSGAVFHFGVLGPLALFGIIVSWSRRDRVGILYWMIGAYASTLLLFFVLARYRLPLVPLMLPFAAAALTQGPRWLRERLRKAPLRAALAASAVFLLAIVANGYRVDRTGMEATAYYNLGLAKLRSGESEVAKKHYRKALEIVPVYTETLLALGSILAQQNQLEEANALFARALTQEPDIAPVRIAYGEGLARSGDFQRALPELERAIEIDPYRDAAFYVKALVELRLGRREDGRASMEEAIRLNPGNRIRLRHAAWLRAAAPETPGPRDADRSLQMARWAVQIGGNADPLSLSTLSAALATAGEFERAIRAGEQALYLAEQSEDPDLRAVMRTRLDKLARGERIRRYAADRNTTPENGSRYQP